MAIYLNSSSTDYESTGRLNPSDRALPPNVELEEAWEEYEQKIKKYVGAPDTAKVVVVSGASEAVATCMNWARATYGSSGTVWGSTFDHPTIKLNAKNYGFKYSQEKNIPNDTVAVVITHVDPKNGEIYDIDEWLNKMKEIRYLSEGNVPNFFSKTLMYRPLIFLDVSQSITKIPINMEKWGGNALFFSLHKIGGDIGTGILVVEDRQDAPFKPLIAGYQQEGFRGGTYPLDRVISCNFFKYTDDIESRKKPWEEGLRILQSAGLDVYVPKTHHLYNTYLIKIGDTCPLKVINAIAEIYGIYIGTASACKGEQIKTANKSKNKDEQIRISFKHGKDINKEILEKIAEVTIMIMTEPDDSDKQ